MMGIDPIIAYRCSETLCPEALHCGTKVEAVQQSDGPERHLGIEA